MADIASIVAPIFIVIAAGYVAVRVHLLEQAALGRFVLYAAMPALIVLTLGQSDLQGGIEPYFLLAYGGGTLATYGLTFALSKAIWRNDTAHAGVKSLGASFSNSAFVGYPLLLQAFDTPPVTAFAMALMFENVVMMPLVLTVLELGASSGREPNWTATFRGLIRRIAVNPIIIAIAVGLALSISGLSLPAPLAQSLELLGKASAGAALFFIGGTLVGNSIRGSIANISQIVAIKLIVHPLMVGLAIALLPAFDHDLKRAALLLAACPMMALYPLLSGRAGLATLASSALLAATVASAVTISTLLVFI